MLTIDAHQHFWRYNEIEYGWIPDAMAELRRDFLPADLRREIAAAGVDRVISVQARQSLPETDWLLELAAANDFIAGVVGWLPLAAANFPEQLARYRVNPKLRGLRHVIQDEPDPRFMLGDAFNRGVALLADAGLVYDILIYPRHLATAVEFVKRHRPNQRFVLDHLAKPEIRTGAIEPWASELRRLAALPNVACKLSGMVTEADLRHWRVEELRPYCEIVLDAFGPERVLFGSDWPVCLGGVGYGEWKNLVETFAGADRELIMGGNARLIYGV